MACSGFLVLLLLLRGDARARIATLIVSNAAFLCAARGGDKKTAATAHSTSRLAHGYARFLRQ